MLGCFEAIVVAQWAQKLHITLEKVTGSVINGKTCGYRSLDCFPQVPNYQDNWIKGILLYFLLHFVA